MIAVVADDITGAAEIAGVGLRYGMTIALTTTADIAPPLVQLWVLALDTRSMCSQDAIAKVTITLRRLKMLGVKDIFKKTDSVLRGHVLKELKAQLEAEGKKKVILCPANPQGGRQIVDGIYLINGIPISKTSFARDPEFPVTTSVVTKMLGEDLLLKMDVSVINATSGDDLSEAAKRKDKYTILAGSAAFFNAYLAYKKLVPVTVTNNIPKFEKALYVFGSTFDKSRQALEKARESGAKVAYISPLLMNCQEVEANIESCLANLIETIKSEGRAILAVGNPILTGREAAVKIKQSVACVVKKVYESVSVHELVVEGGGTTFAIIDALNFKHFIPINELAKGVVRMKVVDSDNLYLTIKPGSYDFPAAMWTFSKQNK